MATSTLGRDYDIDRTLADHERRISALERRMLRLAAQVDAIGLWQPFTPTWTGVVVGAGGVSAGRYVQMGQTVHVMAQLVLGAGGDVTATPVTLTPPLTPNLTLIFDAQSVSLVGLAGARDDSAGVLEKAAVQLQSTGTVRFTPTDVAGGQWGVASPFDWAVDDQLNVWFSYETTDPAP